jgi:hypothetical protein
MLSEANSYSGWNRRVKQTATMILPGILAKSSTRGRWGWCAGVSRRRGTVEGAVHAVHVVIIRECVQLSPQVDRVPEEHVIEIFVERNSGTRIVPQFRARSRYATHPPLSPAALLG